MRRDPSSLRSVGMTGTRLLSSVLYHLYIAFLRSLTLAPSGVDRWFAALQDDRYASIVLCSLFSALCYLYSVLCSLYSILCTLFREHPCISEVNMHAVLVRLARIEIFILGKVYSV